MNDEEYMEIAYQEALKCLEKDEVPVGAVIVKNNEVISCAHNLRETTNLATAHAEILAINEACKINFFSLAKRASKPIALNK